MKKLMTSLLILVFMVGLLPTNSVFASITRQTAITVPLETQPASSADFSDLTKDVTGDGKADVVGVQANTERFVAWPSSGSAFKVGVEWRNGPFNYFAYQFRSADVNGDGKADIIGISANNERFVVWTSTGSAFKAGVEWLDGSHSYLGYQFRVADVNGDGKADIVGLGASDERFVVWTSSGSAFSAGVEWRNGSYNYSGYQFYVANVNGDGKADIIGIAANKERFVVFTSTGSVFNAGVEWRKGLHDDSAYQFRVADVNGDGKADIVGILASNERFLVWTNTGSAFNAAVEWKNGPFNYSTYQFRVADVNGDGKADIVGIAADNERFVVWTSTGSVFKTGVEWHNGPFDYSGYRF